MSIPTPYLQTLSQEEASTFVASLQKIKEHLSSELEWMNQQVEQKTIQLRGIETLLAEAKTAGLLTPDAGSQSSSVTTATPAPVQQILKPDLAATASVVDTLETILESNGSVPAQFPAEPQAVIAISPATDTESQQPAKSATKSKSRATKKPRATTAKKTKSTYSKASRANEKQDLREMLLSEFADKSLTDAVAQVLDTATQPLHINELLIEMYGNLTGNDLKRARVSLANVLSMGKKKGKWQSVGNGLYQANDA